MKMMLVLGGGMAGYMYLKKHPEKMEKMKEMTKKICKMEMDMLDA